jgi:hypothetical protein
VKKMNLSNLLDDNSDLSKVVAALLELYNACGEGGIDQPFQDILKDFLEREVIPLPQVKHQVLLDRLFAAAAWLQATAAAAHDQDEARARYDLARKLDNMRAAIYRRLAARTSLPPSDVGGAWFSGFD